MSKISLATRNRSRNNLNFLFSPDSIAVIGASRNRTKLGYMVLKNIKDYGYKGKIYPINLHDKKILGLKCYGSVLDIEGKVDLAVFVIPAKFVLQALQECGQKGVKGAVIISAGFRETGAEGGTLEDEVKKIAKKYNIRLLGPNCLGIINTETSLNASFAESMPARWDISVFSQSGAMCTAILDWANANGIGFSKFVSLGNKSDISENDLLVFWEKDKDTKVILGYLEGIEDGKKFLGISKKITKKKPLVIIKSGSSDDGARAIASHTGSLAGYDEAAEAAFKEAGVTRARTIQDLFDFAKIFSFSRLPKGNKVAVITNAGGPGVMATDYIDENKNLEMADLSKKTKKALSKVLPSTSNIKNPIDVVGDAKANRFQDALDIVLKAGEVDIVLIILTPQVMTEVEKTAKIIAIKKRRSKKPIIASFVGGEKVKNGVSFLERKKVPVYVFPERAVKSIEAIYSYSQYLEKKEAKHKDLKMDYEAASEIFKNAKDGLTEIEVSGILGAYGIPVAKSLLAKDKKSVVRAAGIVKYPVVLKVASPDIIHKTDIGGVRMGLKNKEEVEQSFEKIMENIKKNRPNARVKGVTVFHMVREGQEVIIGAKRDEVFGPIVMFGLGGLYVELLKDVVFHLCPVSKENAYQMIGSIKASNLLKGYRGKWASDIDAIADAITRLSKLMLDFPEIKEVDINPFRVNEKGKGGKALDAKIIL